MEPLDKEKFGAYVAHLRRKKNLTQQELARQLYVTDKAVSKWERGLSLPDTALLLPLSRALGITVTQLLLCGNPPPADPGAQEELRQSAEALSRSVRTESRLSRYLPENLLNRVLEVLCWLLLTRLEWELFTFIATHLPVSNLAENLLFLIAVIPLNLILLVPLSITLGNRLARWIGWHWRG